MIPPTTLQTHLAEQPAVPADLRAVLLAVAEVAARLSAAISMGELFGSFAAEVGRNSDGDAQKALDLMADEAFSSAFEGLPVRWYASEEREEANLISPEGTLAVAIDPLDGSSNIDVNVSIGTIFSVFEARETAQQSFLRPGREQIAAGYAIYGPQTALVLAHSQGVAFFILDRAQGTFLLARDGLEIPASASEFAINASNYRHWSKPIRAYIDDCLSGIEGPHGRNSNMRWVASLVAETHRVMMRGGIFLYPSDRRPGYERGRLRMVYECAPIAFVVEKAGGRATDGIDPILDQSPAGLHVRTPFVFGSADKVARVAAYHDLPPREVSPLFGSRGLFSA